MRAPRNRSIIDRPRGNALLVGVGGSGKQSLARLAAFIASYEVFQITITSTYGVEELKADLKTLYFKAGLKNIGMMFLFTDTQIVDERFLVYINDVLSSGLVADLLEAEDKDNIANTLRNEVKAAGLPDTKENCLDFFIEKVSLEGYLSRERASVCADAGGVLMMSNGCHYARVLPFQNLWRATRA